MFLAETFRQISIYLGEPSGFYWVRLLCRVWVFLVGLAMYLPFSNYLGIWSGLSHQYELCQTVWICFCRRQDSTDICWFDLLVLLMGVGYTIYEIMRKPEVVALIETTLGGTYG